MADEASAANTASNLIVDYVTSTVSALVSSEGQGHDHGGQEVHVEHKGDMTMEMLSTAKRMHFVTSGVLGPVLVVLGLVGNILSIFIWTRPNMRSSTGRYLTCLALADCGVLVWFILVDTLMMLAPEVANSASYAVFFAYLGYPLFFLWVILSIWFMVGVTVDRFIMVCLMTKAKEYCNEYRANVGVGLIFGLCFLINLPHFWSFTVDWERGLNGTGPALVKTDFQQGPGGIRYEFWVHCIFLVLVPWFSVFVLNMLIIQTISRTNRRMSSKKTLEAADKSKRSENQVTRLLLLVTFTFLILIGFQCITQCFYMLMPDGFDKNLIDESFAVAKLGIIINSSVNFLLYCLSGRRFRHELYVLLRCKKRGLRYLSSHSTSSQKTGSTAPSTGSPAATSTGSTVTSAM